MESPIALERANTFFSDGIFPSADADADLQIN